MTAVLLSLSVAPSFASTGGSHTLTVQTNSQSYSCQQPIIVSGTALGQNLKDKPVRVVITNDISGKVVAHGKAAVSNGAYTITFTFTNNQMQGGPIFVVTATWHHQVAQTGPFDWSC